MKTKRLFSNYKFIPCGYKKRKYINTETFWVI